MTQLLSRRKVLAIVLAIVWIAVVVVPVLAQGTAVLEGSFDQMRDSQQWWDNLWQQTFAPPVPGSANVSVYWFTNIARVFVMIILPFWIFGLGNSLASSGSLAGTYTVSFRYFLVGLVVVMLLANEAQLSRNLALGLRGVINAQRNGLMEVQILDLSLREAITDQMITRDAADRISQQAQICAQMPRPGVVLPSPTPPADRSILTREQEQAYAFLDCLRSLERVATEIREEQEQAVCGPLGFACAFFTRFLDRTINSIVQSLQTEVERFTSGEIPDPLFVQNFLSDFLVGLGISAALGPLLNKVQWIYINLLEMALWLSGLSAPLFAALALVPGQLNMAISWLITFMSIGLMQIMYVLIVGVVAVLLSQNPTFLASDLRFPLALAVFAPIISSVLVTAGGLAAARAFARSNAAVISGVASIVSAGFGAIGYAVSRSFDKHR